MIIINEYIHDLKFQDGIWQASGVNKICYPGDGNNSCYELEDKSFWFNHRNKIIYEAILKYSIKGPIFDVGGGNGFVSKYLNELGFETVLVEPGVDGCINGRERGLVNVINANFDDKYFYPNRIPNLGIFDVLEHIENQNKFLEIIHNNIRSDGILFITVPAYKALWSEEDDFAGHYRRYEINGLQKLMENNGFDVLYVSYFFSFLVIPICIFRSIPSLFGFYNISHQKSKNQHLSNSEHSKSLNKLIEFELNKVKRGKSLLFGSSLLLVARNR